MPKIPPTSPPWSQFQSQPPEPGQPDLAACWYVFHSIRAASVFVERWQRTKNSDDWIRGAIVLLDAKDESPTPSSRARFLLALDNPPEFLSLCEGSLNREIASREERSGDEQEDVIDELLGKLKSLANLRRWWQAMHDRAT